MKNKEMGIYDLVKGVREELKKIIEDPEIKDSPLLGLKSLELEVNVVVSNVTDMGIKFYVITAGDKHKKEQINKIKLNFEPLTQLTPTNIEVAGDKGAPILLSPVSLETLKEIMKTEEQKEKK